MDENPSPGFRLLNSDSWFLNENLIEIIHTLMVWKPHENG